MIWSNQTSGTPIPHSQSESPHFNRPLVSGFGMDHTGFPSNLLAASSPSMMDPQHMDSVAMHQRKMQQHLPINQFLAGSQMPDRIHPSNMNDRMPGMFSQPAAVQQMITPIRMGYHPHPQFSDSFIQAPLNREPPVRIQQQNANQPVNAFTVNPAVAAALNIAAAQPPRSPHVAPQEKNWSWEEQQQPEVSEPPPVKEPVEDFGYGKVDLLYSRCFNGRSVFREFDLRQISCWYVYDFATCHSLFERRLFGFLGFLG